MITGRNYSLSISASHGGLARRCTFFGGQGIATFWFFIAV